MGIETLYLSGGGDEIQSANLDDRFVRYLQESHISKLIYIPVALNPDRFSGAENWFRRVFANRVPNIEVWTNLDGENMLDSEDMSLYIGGGNTIRLLREIRESDFDKELVKFVKDGGIVYGGSAGAIILGADIRTAPEVEGLELPSYKGLDLLGGKSVACHFNGTEEEISKYRQLKKKIITPIIAISEQGGVIVRGNRLEIVGEKEVFII